MPSFAKTRASFTRAPASCSAAPMGSGVASAEPAIPSQTATSPQTVPNPMIDSAYANSPSNSTGIANFM
ncbi:MAG: hypothetical protein ACKO14_12270 [Armatimonadota bacterium]